MDDFIIKELKIFQLNEFKKILSTVFHYEKTDIYKYYLSLFPILFQKIIRIFGHVRYSKYWVALNNKEEIVGIIGIYFRDCDPKDVLWVSWFCVKKQYRRKGIGGKLLNHVISYAKENNKTKFKIYTSNHDNEKNAQYLYEKFGFLIIEEVEIDSGYVKIYREKKLIGSALKTSKKLFHFV
jgi:ribosomal protein S18 acetylase RimI-like enzyme